MGLFITGATGFLGKTTLVKLLKQKMRDSFFIDEGGTQKICLRKRGTASR